MAQSNTSNVAASAATRSPMNSMAALRTHHRHRHMARNGYWSASRLNGHGINRLGTTTNSGRKYNGG
jgi:hypothetical protein